MQLTRHIKTLGRHIADLVFPVYCLSCGIEGKFVCDGCIPRLARLDRQICIVCQTPAPFGKTHPQCVSANKLDGIISALPYRNPQIANLIETFKYKFIDDLSPILSKFLIDEIENQNLNGYFSGFTLIPIPLHPRRYSWRGFNQAELIAQSLSKDLEIPVNKELVKRIKFTQPQVKLERSARQENMKDAFGLTQAQTAGKYLLVDDVVTTGATLNEIAKLLKRSGASEVWALTVAHG